MTPKELWESHQGLAKTIAASRANTVIGGSGYRSDALEDLTQAALIGLWVAAHRFDPSRGVSFATFAWSYIKGEVLWESWRLSFWGFNGGRAGHQKKYKLPARHAFPQMGATPTECERIEHVTSAMPSSVCDDKDLCESLLKDIPSKTEREVLKLYYLEGFSTSEVAERLGLSTHRIEQARAAGIRSARAAYEKQEKPHD